MSSTLRYEAHSRAGHNVAISLAGNSLRQPSTMCCPTGFYRERIRPKASGVGSVLSMPARTEKGGGELCSPRQRKGRPKFHLVFKASDAPAISPDLLEDLLVDMFVPGLLKKAKLAASHEGKPVGCSLSEGLPAAQSGVHLGFLPSQVPSERRKEA